MVNFLKFCIIEDFNSNGFDIRMHKTPSANDNVLLFVSQSSSSSFQASLFGLDMGGSYKHVYKYLQSNNKIYYFQRHYCARNPNKSDTQPCRGEHGGGKGEKHENIEGRGQVEGGEKKPCIVSGV